MELGHTIKTLRNERGLSQDELADRVFVSRQSISNWENDKTYPDIQSLLLLCQVFSVSLDSLVKGDIPEMKKKIDQQEFAAFQRDNTVFTVLFFLSLLPPVPMALRWGWRGLALSLIPFGVTMYYAFRVERYKKKYDIQTYREITAFMEGRSLSEIEKAREAGKRPYQKLLLALASAILGAAVAVAMFFLFRGLR